MIWKGHLLFKQWILSEPFLVVEAIEQSGLYTDWGRVVGMYYAIVA